MRKRFLPVLVLALTALVGCQAPIGPGPTGTLVLSFDGATARSLLPDISMDIARYEIDGAGPDGAVFTAASTGGPVTVRGLPFGEWTVTVRGLNASGAAIGIGSALAVVHTGRTTEVGITVRPYEGDGSLSLTVGWNAADLDVPSVEARLTPVAGADIVLPFAVSGASASFSSSAIPAGYYTLSVQLKDNGITVMGAVETVRIVKGALTSGSFAFTDVNKPGGNISINIVADMGDPLTVSLAGLSAQLAGTAVMNLTASIAESVNAVYVWYLNGESVATGAAFPVAGLPDGFYRVDVTAISADGSRAGSASGSFRAVGAIDLSPYLTIHAVQGASHVSPYADATVPNVVGIVTAKDNKGFWMQSPVPDADPATSEGILVYFNAAPAVQVGDLVVVSGTVKEYGFNAELRITEIATPTVVTTLAAGVALPDATVIGRGGRMPPTQNICDDGTIGAGGAFDPDADAIDFYESLEHMLVRVNDAVVTGSGSYGELAVVADSGLDVPAERRTSRGGVSIAEGNFNPEMMIIDTDAYILGLPPVEARTGDALSGPVIGVMGYSYGNFLVLPTSMPAVIPGNLGRETSALAPAADRLTVASFNIENFPRSVDTMTAAQIDAKVADIAQTIVQGLNCPDIIVVEEMTDDSWSVNNGTVAATANWNRLIAAIIAAGGPDTYQFRQIDPVNNQDGGWAGANIRVGFIFNGARVSFADIPGGSPTTSISVTSDGGLGLSASPGRISVASFSGSRKPLAGKFIFNGKPVFVIGNHLASKGGDDPLWGMNQPPVLASETERLVQANALDAFVDQMLAVDPEAAIIVAGDLNDFAFSAPIRALQGGVLRNLVDELLPSAERYTYVYDGNSQQLDHIIVSPALFAADPQVDVVHRNAELAPSERHTDHDPVLASFLIPGSGGAMPPSWISGYPSAQAQGQTAAIARFKLNVAGTVHCVLKADGSAPPTAAELAAGPALSLAAMTEGSLGFEGLSPDTAYDLYAIADDNLGNAQPGPVLVELRTEAPVVVPPAGLAGLFFSDYGEGSSNNKYLEVCNVSGAPVLLTAADGTAKFFMLMSTNGAAFTNGQAIIKFPAGMTIAQGGLVGVYNASAVAAIKAKMPAEASFSSTATYFNGNDAVALVQDLNGNGAFDLGVDAIVDIFGYPGVSTNYAVDVGYRRNPDIATGSQAFDPAQWTQYPLADVNAGTYYGVHP